MAEERWSARWRAGVGVGAGECLVLLALWTLGGLGFLLVTFLASSLTSSPAVVAPAIALLVLMIGWGVVLTIQHRPGVYLAHLTKSRRAELGPGWFRWMSVIAMASVQISAVALFGYFGLALTFG